MSTPRAVIGHTLEVSIAMLLPQVINTLFTLGANSKWLMIVGLVVVAAAKIARELGWLPDYADSSTGAATVTLGQ